MQVVCYREQLGLHSCFDLSKRFGCQSSGRASLRSRLVRLLVKLEEIQAVTELVTLELVNEAKPLLH